MTDDASMIAAVVALSTAGVALAQTTVTQTTETTTTIGVVDGDGMEMATTEQITVTTEEGSYSSDTNTTTADYDRYFDAQGNPTYMPDVSFSLE